MYSKSFVSPHGLREVLDENGQDSILKIGVGRFCVHDWGRIGPQTMTLILDMCQVLLMRTFGLLASELPL